MDISVHHYVHDWLNVCLNVLGNATEYKVALTVSSVMVTDILQMENARACVRALRMWDTGV